MANNKNLNCVLQIQIMSLKNFCQEDSNSRNVSKQQYFDSSTDILTTLLNYVFSPFQWDGLDISKKQFLIEALKVERAKIDFNTSINQLNQTMHNIERQINFDVIRYSNKIKQQLQENFLSRVRKDQESIIHQAINQRMNQEDSDQKPQIKIRKAITKQQLTVKKTKLTNEQKQFIVQHYLEHGKSYKKIRDILQVKHNFPRSVTAVKGVCVDYERQLLKKQWQAGRKMIAEN